MNTIENINNLEVCVDWLGFTFFTFSTPFDVLGVLGLPADEFSVCNGSNGYKSSLRHSLYPITVLYDGRADMGIHVNISGGAIAFALDKYMESIKIPTPFGDYGVEYSDDSIMIRYLKHIHDYVKFTRVDLAIDDKGSKYYSVDDVREICDSGLCATRFRKYRPEFERSFDGSMTGNTLYIGKRQSDVFLRIYDKRLEQIHKTKNDVGYEWVRWELELKKERADIVVNHLISGLSLGSVAIGILSNYFRVIVRDNDNVTRCSSAPLWETFVCNVEKLRLTVSKPEKNLDQKKEWICRQCMPSISAIVASENGDLGFITDRLNDSLWRNKKAILDMIFLTNPELKEDMEL